MNDNQKLFIRILLPCLLTVPVAFFAACVITTAYLFTQQPIWRATTKVMVPVPKDSSQDAAKLYLANERQRLLSQPVLRETAARLKKTSFELREFLANATAERAGDSTVVALHVDSVSRDFARDFANTWADAYLAEAARSLAESPTVIERASLGDEPVYPRKAKTLRQAALAGVAVGLFLAVVLTAIIFSFKMRAKV